VRAAGQTAVAVALAQADGAEREQAQTRLRVQAEAWRLLGEALQGVRQTQRQQVAAQALVRSAQLQERAWTLGEGTLADVLLAQRTAAEARLAAERAHVDAAAALARLEAHSPSVWADAGR
jgi:outer membrane protein TolC